MCQEYASNASDWKAHEPAMASMALRLSQGEPESREVVVQAPGWVVRIGPVDLRGAIITLQRGDDLIAAIVADQYGGLIASTYRPLDGRALGFLTGLAQRPGPDGLVSMRPNNWEYALDQSALADNAYAANAGITYLSFWEFGLGLSADGTTVDLWHDQRSVPARTPVEVVAELRAFSRWLDLPQLLLTVSPKPRPNELTVFVPGTGSASLSRRGRARGCLLGGGVGDALGAPIESMSITDIRSAHGPRGLCELAAGSGPLGGIDNQ
jgi:hypothetical protein